MTALDKEPAMSVAEFGLRPESALLRVLSPIACEQSLTDSLALTSRYEGVSRLARSIASINQEFTPDVRLHNIRGGGVSHQ